MFNLAATVRLTLSFWEGRLELVGSVSSTRGRPLTVVGWLHVHFSENTCLRGEAIEASFDKQECHGEVGTVGPRWSF